MPGYGVEEVADTTLCLILNLYRRTFWLANMVKDGKKIQGPEQLKEAAYGCARIRGDTLGIVGLGEWRRESGLLRPTGDRKKNPTIFLLLFTALLCHPSQKGGSEKKEGGRLFRNSLGAKKFLFNGSNKKGRKQEGPGDLERKLCVERGTKVTWEEKVV